MHKQESDFLANINNVIDDAVLVQDDNFDLRSKEVVQ